MDVQIQLGTGPRCPNISSNFMLRGFLVPPRAQKYTRILVKVAIHLNPFCQIRVRWAHRQPRNYQFVRTDRQTDRQTDRRSGPTTRPAFAKATQVCHRSENSFQQNSLNISNSVAVNADFKEITSEAKSRKTPKSADPLKILTTARRQVKRIFYSAHDGKQSCGRVR